MKKWSAEYKVNGFWFTTGWYTDRAQLLILLDYLGVRDTAIIHEKELFTK